MNDLPKSLIEKANEVLIDKSQEYTHVVKSTIIGWVEKKIIKSPYITYYLDCTLNIYPEERKVNISLLPNISGTYPTDGNIEYIDLTNALPEDFNFNQFKDFTIINPSDFVTKDTLSKLKRIFDHYDKDLYIIDDKYELHDRVIEIEMEFDNSIRPRY